MNIDYNAVTEILKSFLDNEKTEILGISVGEERQVREAIKNLLTAYEKEKEKNKEAKNLLIDMVNQFAYEDNNPKTRGSSEQKIYTAGLSTLEDAFYLLDIDEGIKREDLWKLKEE